MKPQESAQFRFDDLRELADKHAQQKLQVEKLIPETTNLGLFIVRNAQRPNRAPFGNAFLS